VFLKSRKSGSVGQPRRSGSARWNTRTIAGAIGVTVTPIVVAIISSSSSHAPVSPTTGAPQGAPPTTGSQQSSPGNSPGPNVLIVPVPGQPGYGPQGAPMQDPAQHIPSSTIPNPAVRPIKITTNSPVPRCATFDGTGDVPQGQTLWLIVFTPGSRKYYPKPVTVAASTHGWTARNVLIGAQDDPADTTYMIYATLVDNSSNLMLEQNRSAGLTYLPGSKAAELSVTRNKDMAPC
jgi:hypothetical protein